MKTTWWASSQNWEDILSNGHRQDNHVFWKGITINYNYKTRGIYLSFELPPFLRNSHDQDCCTFAPLVGDSYKPAFATITGKGDNPTSRCVSKLGDPSKAELKNGWNCSIWCLIACWKPRGVYYLDIPILRLQIHEFFIRSAATGRKHEKTLQNGHPKKLFPRNHGENRGKLSIGHKVVHLTWLHQNFNKSIDLSGSCKGL